MAFSVLNTYFGLHNFIDTFCRNTGPWYHNRHHGDHQERHDDLHSILHKGHHISNLHGSVIYSMRAVPNDEYGNAVHDQHHHRHHKGHTPIDEKVGFHQFFVGVLKTLFLVLLCTEGPDYINAGKDFPGNQVQIVNEILQLRKFRHGNLKQQTYKKHDHYHCQSQNPGHRSVRLENFIYSADTQNWGIQHNTEDHGKKKLDLLYVVGAPGDQGGCGKFIQLCSGESNNFPVHTVPQISSQCSCNLCGKEGNGNGRCHSQKGQAQHFYSGKKDVFHLHLIQVFSLGTVLFLNIKYRRLGYYRVWHFFKLFFHSRKHLSELFLWELFQHLKDICFCRDSHLFSELRHFLRRLV